MARERGGLVVTCEHGGNAVPREWAGVMTRDRRLLSTHRGFDPGALELAMLISAALRCELHFSTTTRLLVDLNRSIGNEGLFGPSTSILDARARREIVRRNYVPYRRDVERSVAKLARRAGGCDHVSVHSFTPVLRGERREVDIGLLYDPSREREVALARRWAAALRRWAPGLRVKMNQPYKGTDDGFTTYLRTLHADARYAGIELEVNQRFVRAGGERWVGVMRAVAGSLVEVVGE